MAQRRGLLQALLSRHGKPFFSTNPFPNSPLQQPHQPQLQNIHTQILTHSPQNFVQTHQIYKPSSHFSHHFSSKGRNDDSGDEDGELADELEDDDEEEEESDDEGEVDENEIGSGLSEREYSIEEKEKEACEIGYKVIGPLEKSDRVFKPYEPVFAVVQIGSHQFKVSNGDCIFTERLKFCEVNDKLLLNKVLLLGSSSQTIIGRPILPDAAVYAIVEEHALDAKVIIFKKKRRKNYCRTKGHRQELTKLRIVDIQGVEKPEPAPLKPEKPATKKPEKIAAKKQEKVAVVA